MSREELITSEDNTNPRVNPGNNERPCTEKSLPDDMHSPFFNRHEQLKTWINGLSHWEQLGKIQFVTFRLADSLPQSKLADLREMKDCFLTHNPTPWDVETFARFNRIISRKMNFYLDCGYGSCVLRDPQIRKIVSDALDFYDGKRYYMIEYVVMPNHLHTVVEMIGEHEANKCFEDLKRFTARRINAMRGTSGDVWAKTYDRLVRDEDHLKHCISYIRSNPRYLPEGQYTLGGPAYR